MACGPMPNLPAEAYQVNILDILIRWYMRPLKLLRYNYAMRAQCLSIPSVALASKESMLQGARDLGEVLI